jgi:hypothetical protein
MSAEDAPTRNRIGSDSTTHWCRGAFQYASDLAPTGIVTVFVSPGASDTLT